MALLADHYVRVGASGVLARLAPIMPQSFQRGDEVICRTSRGLEVGEIVAIADLEADWPGPRGTIVRSMTPEDRFVWQKLTERRDDAFENCQRMLATREPTSILVDAEILFDARSIFFYFLGPPPTGLEELVAELGSVFETAIRFEAFVDAVETGCGPDCGTEDASGCGSSCQTCSVLDSCKTSSGKK